ncbi:MAG: Ig-like domain-containing protein [Myxococcota bacterium]
MMRVLLFAALAGCPGSGLDPVTPPPDTKVEGLLGILVTPENVVVPLGEGAQLKVTGLFEDRTSNDLTALVDWTSDNPGIAEVSGGLDAEGQLSAHSVGTANIRAVLDGLESPPIRVEVTEAFLENLTVSPNQIAVEAGSTLQLSASARFSNGTTSDASGQVRWITDNGSVAQLDARGLLTAAGPGTTQIRAQWNDIASTDVPVSVLQNASADLAIAWTNLQADGNVLTFTASIENVGTAGASDFWVDAFLDPSLPPDVGDIGQRFERVTFLGPGARHEVEFAFTVQPGQHSVVVLLDSTDVVAESNEGNNLGDAFASAIDHEPEANLQVTSFTYLSDDTDILYFIEVRNVGDAASGQFYLDLYVDHFGAPAVGEEGDEFLQMSSLGPGQTGMADFLVTQDCFLCSSWVFVDSFGEVSESNETDNLEGPMYVNMNDSSF